ncbi:P-loop containing nucleoside triphosphate hydrolase protein, partial [Sodiomyces alkalinus F11]
MDILKVLSRGIKQPSKTTKNVANGKANLPSAGNKINPQLFHDNVSTSRGSKRKRPDDAEGDNADADADLPEVDFFAPNSTPSEETKNGEAAASSQHVEAATTVSSSSATPPTLLSEEECRQLLRSHRLKLTLLSNRHVKSKSKITKTKKNKKAKVEVGVEVKDDPVQFYPQPLSSFRELRSVYNIPSKLAENIQHEGYKMPTEVQLGSLPLLLRPELALENVPNSEEMGDVSAGIDFLAIAPTGSGKTISFLVPAIDSILRRRAAAAEEEEEEEGEEEGDEAKEGHQLRAIVMAPTRELVFQIVNEGRKLALGTGIKISGMRKGVKLPTEEQEKEHTTESDESEEDEEEAEESSDDEDGKPGDKASRPVTRADILVTTPAMLYGHLTSGSSSSKTRKILPTVHSLILDEADVLLDPIFREQTLGVWSACTNPNLRASFWSATMSSTIESLLKETLASRSASTSTRIPLVRLVVGLKDTAVPNITHKLTYTASEQGKLLALRQLLRPTTADDSGPPLRPPFLVFTQTIDRASALHEELKYDIPLAAGGPTRIAALHSGLSDAERAGIMRRFRAGDIWVLITTDVLARGVDFAGVNGIVNYDIPGSTAAYVHRAGRTGRAGREGGLAVTFYTKDDIPFVKTVANVIALSERQAGKKGDDAAVQKWLLDALPDVNKDDRKRLRERGVESRRSGGAHAKVTSQSGWERQKENNRKGAVEASKKRKKQERQ